MTSPREQAIEEAAKEHHEEVRRILEPKLGMLPRGWDDLEEFEREINRRQARAAIDAYESARARLDGAKMMPREADMNMLIAGLDALVTEIKRQNGPRPQVDDGQVLTDDEAAQRYMALGSEVRSSHEVAEAYRAMHDATPKEKD